MNIVSVLISFLIAVFLVITPQPIVAHGNEDDGNPITNVSPAETIPTLIPQPTKETEEVNKLWCYVAFSFIGFGIGSIGTFVLLTTTLHPKK